MIISLYGVDRNCDILPVCPFVCVCVCVGVLVHVTYRENQSAHFPIKVRTFWLVMGKVCVCWCMFLCACVCVCDILVGHGKGVCVFVYVSVCVCVFMNSIIIMNVVSARVAMATPTVGFRHPIHPFLFLLVRFSLPVLFSLRPLISSFLEKVLER